MSPSLVAGLAAGLGSVVVSEALLAWWSRRPETPALKVVFTGLFLRTVWMVAALAFGLGSGRWAARDFIAALLGTYLIAQVVEGFRYRRFVDSR